MPYWVFRDKREAVGIEAEDWLQALPEAIEELIGDEWTRTFVRVQDDGEFEIAGPEGIIRMIARRVEGQPVSEGRLLRGDLDSELGQMIDIDAALEADLDTRPHREEPAPPLDYAEKVFEASQRITEADTNAKAAAQALEVLKHFVPSEASSVLRAEIDDNEFTIIAAHGPVSQRVVGHTVPLTQGLAGRVNDTGVSLLIHDIARNALHLHHFDTLTGYRPQAMIVVPIKSNEGKTFGVIELLSSEDEFSPWHVTLAEEVGIALATRMEAAQDVD